MTFMILVSLLSCLVSQACLFFLLMCCGEGNRYGGILALSIYLGFYTSPTNHQVTNFTPTCILVLILAALVGKTLGISSLFMGLCAITLKKKLREGVTLMATGAPREGFTFCLPRGVLVCFLLMGIDGALYELLLVNPLLCSTKQFFYTGFFKMSFPS